MKEDGNFGIAVVKCTCKGHPEGRHGKVRTLLRAPGYLPLQPAGQRASGTAGPPHSHWPRCWSNGVEGAAEGGDLRAGRGRGALARTALGGKVRVAWVAE